MNLSFKFALIEVLEGPSAEFSLGHLVVRGSAGTADSTERGPSGAMVVSLSVVDLLYSAQLLIANHRRLARGVEDRYEFIGADSSFQLVLTQARGQVAVHHGRVEIASLPLAEFASVCERDLCGFEESLLATGAMGTAAGDLRAAVADFRRVVAETQVS
ncbi:hypothetical protein EV385_4075 [Krasilnikovia cinnamomea]|uniref:Uncharacterized protein n=1 Tax=Krasilnikovia cinnamomea TaxID=349313 RepID=A0A4Q7ZMK0_9ACTN|nr:hypothetical protein [Krasilnikovia cinnamomea]RZU52228.1 hypothetical protein EV385_4075 [Krasilnikovia cinnamomea]